MYSLVERIDATQPVGLRLICLCGMDLDEDVRRSPSKRGINFVCVSLQPGVGLTSTMGAVENVVITPGMFIAPLVSG